ncbi:MAG: ATP-binding protein [Candidatus Omnitrophica bacterium]|nr:ATP-binding protein [Candidatus Omnitrophota bacterium]
MYESKYLINFLGMASLASIIFLGIVILVKMNKIRHLNGAVTKLKKSLDEMDEQAKLIVRTDIELNKIQEELDKKITGLYALQRLSHQMSTTMEEGQIFKKIEVEHLEDLDFEKACAFSWSSAEKTFILQMSLGYTQEDTQRIKSATDLESAYLDLIHSGKTLSSDSLQKEPALRDKIKSIFKVTSFVLSPVSPKEGDKGFLFLGTESIDTIISEGDRELITILANQIGQALENARLFEKTWRSQQDLEKKVEERTQELTHTLDELRIVSKRKTDFISSVSHELRTPLTSIKGYASILLTGNLGAIPDQIRERLDKINRHSDELVQLVNNLLDIARIESGREIMKKEIVDLNAVTEKVSDLLSVQFKDHQIEFSAQMPEEARMVSADRSQIERVFINIIGNAIKFTPAGGKITVQSHKVDKNIQVDINDTGCGMPEEALEAIFEEFYRVDNLINQQTKGTGLGLTLVKHIIEAHNGKIWVKSRINAGSTFSFTMPESTQG